MPDERPTLSEILEKGEILLGLKEAIHQRLVYCTEDERLIVEALSNRILQPACSWDRKHRLMLYALALAPDHVSRIFKLRERVHRLLYHGRLPIPKSFHEKAG